MSSAAFGLWAGNVTAAGSGQGVARSETECRPSREVMITAAELQAVFDRDRREVGIGHEARGRLRVEHAFEELQVARTRLGGPGAGP